MKKYIISIFLFVLIFKSNAQVKEKYFFDETSKPVTIDEFHKRLDHKYNLAKGIENDTAIFVKLVPRITYGKIKLKNKKQLVTVLEKITNKTIDSTQTVIINFFFKKNSCINSYRNDIAYIKKIKQDNSLIQFFITAKNYKYNKRNIHSDEYDVIRKLFFEFDFKCGNYVIIKPNGEFYRYYGEYKQWEIINIAKSDWHF